MAIAGKPSWTTYYVEARLNFLVESIFIIHIHANMGIQSGTITTSTYQLKTIPRAMEISAM